MTRTWLITGCSSGFGNEIAKAALAEGDNVVATSRNATKLQGLKEIGALTLSLDVNARDNDIEAVVAEAVKTYGTINILVNNAGYVLKGGVEEIR
jgi:NAD(P)-dependent dehydrogenase (short-subunit alcohol dehydrogenase family)